MTTKATESKTPDTAKYVVVGAGALYAADGDQARIQLGLQNRVIDLVDSEAERLLLLGAIRAASDEDVEVDAARAQAQADAEAAEAAGPEGNPYGGTALGGAEALQKHAAEQIALAKSNAKKK